MIKLKNYLLFLSFIISCSLSAQFAQEQIIASSMGIGKAVFTADLDNDGAIDVLGGTEDFLYWQRNVDGTGLFEKPIILDEGGLGFYSVHGEDLDDDGDMDVLAVSNEEVWVAYYENLGNGEFGPRTILFQGGESASSVYTADMDNDGDPDILAVLKGSSGLTPIRLLINNGNLNFSAPQGAGFTSYPGDKLKAADLNNDSFPEVIVANSTIDNIRIYWNNGAGTYTLNYLTPTDSNMRLHGTIIKDFDNDGALDIFYIDYYTATVYFKNNGDGTFSEVALPDFFAKGIGGDALDYDNDGDIDIVLVNFGSGDPQGGDIRIMTNDGSGGFSNGDVYSNEGLANKFAAVGDLNNDGFVDVVTVSEYFTPGGLNQQLVWYENQDGIDFAPVQSISEGGNQVYEMGLYDFNNDQMEDMYIVSIYNQKITWLEGKGGTEFNVAHTVGYLNGGMGKTVFVDFDLDGDKDFVATDQTLGIGVTYNGQVYYFENDGLGNFSEETLFPGLETETDISNIQLGDFDLDGDLDLVVYQTVSPEGKLSISENLGNGTYGPLEELATIAGGINYINLEDFNNDGAVDIFVDQRYSDGGIYWLENQNGNGFAPKELLVSAGSSNEFIEFEVIDIDQDNDLDIIGAVGVVGSQAKIILYRNLGNNTFETDLSFPTLFMNGFSYTEKFQFDIGDIDADGDLDIVFGEQKLSYMLQEEDGTFSSILEVVDVTNGDEIQLVDLSNDGDLDVIFAYYEGVDKISVFESHSNNASLSGFFFYDENNNGTYESNETKIANQAVDISPTAIATYTTDEGDYKFYVGEGNFTISPQLDDCWTLTSTPATYNVSTNGIDLQDGFNFGVTLNGGDENVAVQMISAPTRCSFTVPFWLTATNQGCTLADGYVQLVLDDLVSLQTVVPSPDVTIGDTLRWNYNNLFPDDKFSVEFTFEIADASNIGSAIEMPASTHYDNGGNFELGNEFLFESEINCAYDPNDKQVYPARTEIGYDDNYLIPDEPLLYTIRFQNTGTDTAFNIVIRDQLSPDLDWTTFQPASASHTFESTLHDDGLAEFHFRDILLVDSFTNEAASHGFVNFSIHPFPGLPENTLIDNTAGIYFDFNAPIVTNTVENVFVLELPALIFPIADFSVVVNEAEATFTNLSQNNPTSSLWTFGDGNSSTDFSPVHIYTATGTYEVCLTVTNDAGANTTCENISIFISSTENIKNDNPYVLMPNPTREKIRLAFEKILPINLTFEVYDFTGRQMMVATQLEDKNIVFDVSQFPKGTYFIKGIRDGEIWLTDYFVVQ